MLFRSLLYTVDWAIYIVTLITILSLTFVFGLLLFIPNTLCCCLYCTLIKAVAHPTIFRWFMYFQIALGCSIIITMIRSIFPSSMTGLLVSFQSRPFYGLIVTSVTFINWIVSHTLISKSESYGEINKTYGFEKIYYNVSAKISNW